MAAISYVIGFGGTLETVTTGTAAPTSGAIELRMDQTAGAVTDSNAPGSTRILKKGEIVALINILEQYLIRDTAIIE